MAKRVRTLLTVIGTVQIVLAVAFFLQLPFITRLWPLQGTTPLTFIFIASILAAAAASTLWATLSKNDGALAGIGLDYLTILTPVAIFLFQLGAPTGNPQLIVSGLVCVFGALFGLILMLWSMRLPLDRTPAMPTPVAWSFVIFILALVFVSSQLILNIPNIIPWTITAELSVVIGWMFAGAACYFIYALIRPSWSNAAGQLAGFLAYDLVLIGPFLQRLPTIAPAFQTGQIIYLIVVIYSGLLAIYYLFIHRSTRIHGDLPRTHPDR